MKYVRLISIKQKLLSSFKYGMNYRPPSGRGAPSGFEIVEDRSKDFRHGIISYDKPLLDKQVNTFQLTPISDKQIEKVKDYVIKKMGKYHRKYVSMYKKHPKEVESRIKEAIPEDDYTLSIPLSDFNKLVKSILKG